ncbi:hypothetical protein BDR26DRAFT_892179 [Obelidium mucronatum]|nr:hypothetical protein BDR26DRAFT_892179 [Obelidium mucronatum]
MHESLNSLLTGLDPETTAVLLSGGLDTSIIVDTLPYCDTPFRFKHAITVNVGAYDPSKPHLDLPYAQAIAEAHGLTHHVLQVDDAMELVCGTKSGILHEKIDTALHTCVLALESFDPMELRGGVALAHALQYAAARGFAAVVTGDGADELFGGYAFLAALSSARLRKWIRRLAGRCAFAAAPLGAALGGVAVVQPFLHARVEAAALACARCDLIGCGDDAGVTHGKLALRCAFPEARSRWRRKVPLETGCGTTPLGARFADAQAADKKAVQAEVDAVYAKYGIVIRDSEHLCYFRVFEKLFAVVVGDADTIDAIANEDSTTSERFAHNNNSMSISWKTKIPRFGSDPCIKCGFQLERPDQYFCKTCGAWPARHGGIPQESDSDEDEEGQEAKQEK